MKIAVWHNLPSGGGARALNNHIRGLLSRGHEVSLWSADPSAAGFIELDGLKQVRQIAYSKPTFSGKDKLRALTFLRTTDIEAMLAHCHLCANEINAGGFDVVFLNSCRQYAVPFIGRFLTIPTVIYLGEPNRGLYEATPTLTWQAPSFERVSWFSKSYWISLWSDLWRERYNRILVREERLNIDSITTLLVNSYFSTESCARAYHRSGEVCYLGINTALFQPKTTPLQKPYVVGLGNLFPHKNPQLAIEALGLLPTANRPRLVWISNMQDTAYVASMRALAVEKQVTFEIKEMIPDDELVVWLSGAVCMVYTSKLEPFGFAPLEANACGTPAIAIPQGGVRETVIDGKTGFLCEERPQLWADKIKLLLTDASLRKEMSDAALNNVLENWTLERATDRIEAALMRTAKTLTS